MATAFPAFLRGVPFGGRGIDHLAPVCSCCNNLFALQWLPSCSGVSRGLVCLGVSSWPSPGLLGAKIGAAACPVRAHSRRGAGPAPPWGGSGEPAKRGPLQRGAGREIRRPSARGFLLASPASWLQAGSWYLRPAPARPGPAPGLLGAKITATAVPMAGELRGAGPLHHGEDQEDRRSGDRSPSGLVYSWGSLLALWPTMGPCSVPILSMHSCNASKRSSTRSCGT